MTDDVRTRGVEALTPVMKSWGVHSQHSEWSDEEAQRDAAGHAMSRLHEAGLLVVNGEPFEQPISRLIHEHSMTLRDDGMECKAGDWPENPEPMPDTEDMLSDERMEYSLNRVLGHQEHLDEVINDAVTALLVEVLTTLENRMDEAQKDVIRTVGRDAGSRVAGLEQAHHILRGVRAEYTGEKS